jgi:hypothetical protein
MNYRFFVFTMYAYPAFGIGAVIGVGAVSRLLGKLGIAGRAASPSPIPAPPWDRTRDIQPGKGVRRTLPTWA